MRTESNTEVICLSKSRSEQGNRRLRLTHAVHSCHPLSSTCRRRTEPRT